VPDPAEVPRPTQKVASDPLVFDKRAARATDHNYLVHSWVTSYRWALPWAPLQAYRNELHGRAWKLIERCKITIACDPGDTDFILGWMCTEGRVLHYAYVRHSLRRGKIFTRLAADIPKPLIVTHCTPCFEQIDANYRYEPSRIGL
jgi:hypothetical protein